MKSGNLNFLEPSGPLQVCNGTALPLTITRKECVDVVCFSKFRRIVFRSFDFSVILYMRAGTDSSRQNVSLWKEQWISWTVVQCRLFCSRKLIGPLGAKQVHATSRPDTLPSFCGEVHSLASPLSNSQRHTHTHTENEKRGGGVREYAMLRNKTQQRRKRRKETYLDL